MEKLKSFTYNNLRWKYRKFALGEIERPARAGYLCMDYLSPFAGTMFDTPENYAKNLCRMLNIDSDVDNVHFWRTNEHFVDADGIAWPEDSFVVIPSFQKGDDREMTPCILVAPLRK